LSARPATALSHIARRASRSRISVESREARRPDGSWRRTRRLHAHLAGASSHFNRAYQFRRLAAHTFGGPRVALNLYVDVATRKAVTRSKLPVIVHTPASITFP